MNLEKNIDIESKIDSFNRLHAPFFTLKIFILSTLSRSVVGLAVHDVISWIFLSELSSIRIGIYNDELQKT